MREKFEFKIERKKESKISPEILSKIETVANIIGGDFKMRVEIGEPGGGSLFNSQERKITLDPLQFLKKDHPKLEEIGKDIELNKEKIQKGEISISDIFSKHIPELKEDDIDMDSLISLVSHEGGHRAITRGPHEIGLRKEKIDELEREIGFFYGRNATEDPADNNWVRNKFPKIGESIEKIYEEQTKKENVPAGVKHPDVQKAIAILGYIPKFAWFGGEVIRYWFKKEFSKELDPDVKEALEKVKEYLPKIFKSIPPEKKTEKETIEKARERFSLYYDYVWPELKKLVKKDIDAEKINQMIEKKFDEIKEQLPKDLKEELERHQKERELKNEIKDIEQQKKELETKGEKLKKEIEDLKEQIEKSSGKEKEELEKQLKEKQEEQKINNQQKKELEKKLKDLKEKERLDQKQKLEEQIEKTKEQSSKLDQEIEKLKKKMDEASGEEKKDLEKQIQEKQNQKQKTDRQLEDLNKQLETVKKIEELKKQQKELQKEGENLEKQIENLKEKLEKASEEEKEKLKKDLEKKQQEKLENNQKQKELEKNLEDLKEKLEKYPSSPLEDFSERLKEKLQEIFDKLPEEEKKELEKKAREKLEDFEDILNENLQGKLNEDNQKSHKEIREEEEKKKEEEKEEERRRKEKEKLEKAFEEAKKEFEEKLEKELTIYDKIYREVAPIIEKLYQRLKRIFEPIEGEWERGYVSGQRLDIKTAMKAKIKPELKTKLFERKRVPKEKDYKFLLLVDMSGSMGGESNFVKITETFKGVVVLTEVLNKLDIPVEVLGFSGVIGVKKYKDFKEKLNKEIRNEKLVRILKETGGGTPTHQATKVAWEELKKELKEHNFLITLTDGQPDSAEALNKVLEKIKKEKKIKLVGIGLGPDTEFVKDFYPASLYYEKITSEKKEETFDEVLAKLLEVLIRYPEKEFHFEEGKELEFLIK
jgi:uncharacterized protein with von Willebrand factor type A (vWA) domain